MSRKASDIAERVRARLPEPTADLDDLLLPPPRLVPVPDDADDQPPGHATSNGPSGAAAPPAGGGDVSVGDGGGGVGEPGAGSEAGGPTPPGPKRPGRRNVATSQRRNLSAGRAGLVERLAKGERSWEVPSVWRARHDVRSIGYDVPGPLALAFAQAKLDLERESGRRLTNEDLVHPALEALPTDPALVATRLARIRERIRTDGNGQRLTAYVAVDLKHKLEDLTIALHATQGLRVHKGILWALAVADLLDSIGVAVPDTIGPIGQEVSGP